MFKLVIAPENMHLYKEIKNNKTILKSDAYASDFFVIFKIFEKYIVKKLLL